MGLFGNIGDFVGSTIGEIGKHPWQAAGAALGVPGFDPAIGGLFNNRPGGALLSPTGNFTSSAWDEMYKDNPGATSGLNMFHRINSVADVVAPMIAGGYALGGLGGAGGSASGSGSGLSGLTSLFGGSGTSTLGPSTISGSGPLFGIGSGMGGSTLTGTAAPELASASPYASAFGGTSMQFPFTLGSSMGSGMNPQMMQQGMQMMQQGQQHQPQGVSASPQLAFGNPMMRSGQSSLGPAMPYSSFGESGASTMSPLAQMLAMRGGM